MHSTYCLFKAVQREHVWESCEDVLRKVVDHIVLHE